MLTDSPASRFPNLGKLSIAILENIVEPLLGEKAIDEIKSPLVEQKLLTSLEKSLENAENRFVREHNDKPVCEAIISLPLATLPSVVQAVRSFYAHPTDSTLEQVLSQQLSNGFPNLPKERVQSGISRYVKILREELVGVTSEIREKLSTIANMNVQENTSRIANTLEQILKHISIDDRLNENIYQSQFNLLRHALKERRNLKSLVNAVYEGEAIYSEGKLPADLVDLLHSARKAFDEIRQQHGALTSKMRMSGLKNRKEVCDYLEQQIIRGERDFYDATLDTIIPIEEALREARSLYEGASESTTEHVIEKVNLILPAHPFQAVSQLREALQQPFCEVHKRILEDKLAGAERLAMRMGRISTFIDQELTTQERNIVRLAVINDWTIKQIAQNTNLSVVEVDIQINRICKKLQSHFGLEYSNLTTLVVLLSPYWV